MSILLHEGLGYICFALGIMNGYLAYEKRQPVNITASMVCLFAAYINLFVLS